jgi:hypothetical protein
MLTGGMWLRQTKHENLLASCYGLRLLHALHSPATAAIQSLLRVCSSPWWFQVSWSHLCHSVLLHLETNFSRSFNVLICYRRSSPSAVLWWPSRLPLLDLVPHAQRLLAGEQQPPTRHSGSNPSNIKGFLLITLTPAHTRSFAMLRILAPKVSFVNLGFNPIVHSERNRRRQN